MDSTAHSSQSLETNMDDIETYTSNRTSSRFKDFYEQNFDKVLKSIIKNKYFYGYKDQTLINRVSPGVKVLEIGCSTGDLISKLNPTYGVGVDISNKAIELANDKYKQENLSFICGDIYNEKVQEKIGDIKFDIIVLNNTVSQLHDVIALLKYLHKHCHSRTRIYVTSYSRLWQPFFGLANKLGLRVKGPTENWLPSEELKQMFYHADFQEINEHRYILAPIEIPIISNLINKFLAHVPIIENLCVMSCFTLRPIGQAYMETIPKKPKVSVLIPCRNESGHIDEIIRRLPELPEGSEFIFVEGNSTDDTEDVIKEAIKNNPTKPFKFYKQPGKGKGDAVREGFSHAEGDILLILDADITVAPEDIPAFVEVLVSGKAEFVNGSRLVYPMEDKAMKFLNLLANKFFAMAFTFLLGQQVRDTLCGTKVLWRQDYDEIVKNRAYFGDFDPFGDFDLLFGASRLGLKILDLPIRYSERTYGDTNISRFRHGAMLFRMTFYAFKKIKMV